MKGFSGVWNPFRYPMELVCECGVTRIRMYFTGTSAVKGSGKRNANCFLNRLVCMRTGQRSAPDMCVYQNGKPFKGKRSPSSGVRVRFD
jgi:hypothetical protein